MSYLVSYIRVLQCILYLLKTKLYFWLCAVCHVFYYLLLIVFSDSTIKVLK